MIIATPRRVVARRLPDQPCAADIEQRRDDEQQNRLRYRHRR